MLLRLKVQQDLLSVSLCTSLTALPVYCRETKSLKLAKLRGCTFVNQYVVIKYLGRGACGRVFLCMDMNDNRLYAVKASSCWKDHWRSSLSPAIAHTCILKYLAFAWVGGWQQSIM